MKLSKAARYFDNTPCFDSYSGDYLFDGQLDVYTEGVRDGVTVQRRVLELDPVLSMPPRGCVTFANDVWIFGTSNPDIWKSKIIRQKYAMHRAEGMAKVWSMKELVDNSTPHEAYAGRVWVKTIKEIEQDSEEYNLLNIYFSRAEEDRINSHFIVEISKKFHIVKEIYPSTAGHLAVVSEMMDEPVIDSLQIDSVRIDPVTEQPVPGSTYRAARLRWQSDFRYHSQMTPKFEHGDLQVVVTESAEVRPDSKVRLSDGAWTVVGTQLAYDVKYVHLRRGH